jgi:hypothetical protein
MKTSFLNRVYRKEYFLFLLPAFFVLHGYVENFPSVPAADALFLTLKYIVAITIIAALFFFIMRSWRKASVLALFVMCFDLFFGSVHDLLKQWLPGSFLVKYTFILPFSLLLLVIAIIYLKRTAKQFEPLVRYVNLLLLLLLLIDTGLLLNKLANQPAASRVPPAGFVLCDSCQKPDIYLIVADEYAGQQELKDIFHFDNSDFENELKARGFHLVNRSISNYNATPYSIASMLSMAYLQNIEKRYKSKKGLNIAYSAINKNNLLDFLSLSGYNIKNYSIFGMSGKPPLTEQSFLINGIGLIQSQTFLSRLDRDIAFNLVTRLKIKFVEKWVVNTDLRNNNLLINKISKEAADTGNKNPRFVYTHLVMPHYPFYFDKNGHPNPLRVIPADDSTREKEYIGYLQYSNKKFIPIIDNILKNAAKPPIIIFMSDHGFREFDRGVDRKYYFMNINAVYLPNGNYSGLYDGMSNVNEFRVILNTAFGQHLPLLKDSSIYLDD